MIGILDIERRLPELAGVPIEKVADNLLSNAYPMERVDAIVRHLVAAGHHFTPADIGRLKSRIPGVYVEASYAHWFALRGYKFTLHDLIELKEIRDRWGQTVAHYMAKSGHDFSPTEWAQVRLWKDSFQGRTVAESAYDYRIAMKEIIMKRSERFALVFEDGRPRFVQNSLKPTLFNRGTGQYAGEAINCLWGEYVDDFGVLPHHSCEIRIRKNNTVRVPDYVSLDEFALVQIIALNHLVERLNSAIQSRQDYDFTDLYQALQLLFIEFVFEMDSDQGIQLSPPKTCPY